jgi:hypothetical protein
MADHAEIAFHPVEGEIVRDRPLKTLGFCLLTIFVLAPAGAGLVWAWWTELSLGDRRISWYGAVIGAGLVLGGILAIPLSVLCFIRRQRLIFGKDCFQNVRGEKVTIQIPYANIARVEMDEAEFTGKFVGIDLHDPNDSQTLCPGAMITKNGFGWHYKITDDSWTMPLTQIRSQIIKRLQSDPSSLS